MADDVRSPERLFERRSTAPIGPPQPMDLYAHFYRISQWVNIAVDRLGLGMKKRLLQVVDKHTRAPNPDHVLQQMIDQPNPHTSGGEFRYADAAWLALNGNSFWRRIRDNSPFQLTRGLMHLRPRSVKLVPDPYIRVKEYHFDLGDGIVVIPARDVIHRRQFSDTDDLWGMSSIQAARLDIGISEMSKRWNHDFFKEGALPNTFLTPADPAEELSVKEMVKLRKRMLRDRKNARNSHIPGIIPHAVKLLQNGANPKDIEWLAGQKFSRDNIGSLWGIPPIMMGQWESVAWANSEAQLKLYWEVTILSWFSDLVDLYNAHIAPEYDEFGPVQVEIDRNLLAELTESSTARTQRLHLSFFDGVISLNEYRTGIGYRPKDDPNMDLHFVPLNLTPLGVAVIGGPSQLPEPGTGAAPGAPAEGTGNVLTAAERETVGKYWTKRLTIEETTVQSAADAIFLKHSQLMQDRIRSASREIVLADVDTYLPSTDELVSELTQALTPVLRSAMANQIARETRRLRTSAKMAKGEFEDEEFEADQAEHVALETVDQGELQQGLRALFQGGLFSRLKNVSEQLRSDMKAQFVVDISLGENPGTMADNIAVAVGSTGRGELIARTETAAALNTGNMVAFTALGADLKQRVTVGDDGRTRKTHLAEETMGPVPIALPFPLTRSMYPGDPAGPVHENANERCTMVPVFSEDIEKSLVRAYVKCMEFELQHSTAVITNRIAPFLNGHMTNGRS